MDAREMKAWTALCDSIEAYENDGIRRGGVHRGHLHVARQRHGDGRALVDAGRASHQGHCGRPLERGFRTGGRGIQSRHVGVAAARNPCRTCTLAVRRPVAIHVA